MISASLYKEIADALGSAQDRGGQMTARLSQMYDDLDESEIRADNVDMQKLVDSVAKTYDVINQNHAEYHKTMTDMVLALQKHVATYYSSVNNFLSDNSIQVTSTFAALSAAVGYQIDDANIESAS